MGDSPRERQCIRIWWRRRIWATLSQQRPDSFLYRTHHKGDTPYTAEEYALCIRNALEWIRWERDVEAHPDPNHELKEPIHQEHNVESGTLARLFRSRERTVLGVATLGGRSGMTSIG